VSAITATPPKQVNFAAIERELTQLWVHPDHGAPEGVTITRVVMSNLVIFCPDKDQASTLPQEIAEIVRIHPARVLLLLTEEGEEGLEAHVSALCHVVAGNQQVCSEHVTIKATGTASKRLPAAVRSLVIGDLPTSLWWASHQPAPPLGGDLFEELAGLSDQVIYESRAWTDPVRDVMAMADWAAREPADLTLADLEWRRMKFWRRLIAQGMDPAVAPGALEALTEIRIEHGPHALAKSWLLLGWLASRLGWQPERGKVEPGQEIIWKFRSPAGPVKITAVRLPKAEENKVHEVELFWSASGKTRSRTFSRIGPGRLAVLPDDPASPPRVIVVPSQARSLLVAKQLPDLERDPLFLDSLKFSRTMAEALR